jgi:hypothetical protein
MVLMHAKLSKGSVEPALVLPVASEFPAEEALATTEGLNWRKSPSDFGIGGRYPVKEVFAAAAATWKGVASPCALPSGQYTRSQCWHHWLAQLHRSLRLCTQEGKNACVRAAFPARQTG